jgi:Holliday junction resolvase
MPKKKEKPSKREGSKEELFLLNELREAIPNLVLTCNSGARHSNGDMGSATYLVEAKSTVHSSYSVRSNLLRQIVERGWTFGKKPILTVLTNRTTPSTDNAFIAIPWDFAIEVLRTYQEVIDGQRSS